MSAGVKQHTSNHSHGQSHGPPAKVSWLSKSRYQWDEITACMGLPNAPFASAERCAELVAKFILAIMQQEHGPDMPIPTILVATSDLNTARDVEALLQNSGVSAPKNWCFHGPNKFRDLAEQWLSGASTSLAFDSLVQGESPTCYLGCVDHLLSCILATREASPPVMRKCTYVVILESPGNIIPRLDRKCLRASQGPYKWLWVHQDAPTDTGHVVLGSVPRWTNAKRLKPGPEPDIVQPILKDRRKRRNRWRNFPRRELLS